MQQEVTFKSVVKRFKGKGGWTYIKVPKSELPEHLPIGCWGYTKITAQLGNTQWKTSLLPIGNGEKFIPLKTEIRKKENIILRDTISVTMTITD